jgi:hypothetical protein
VPEALAMFRAAVTVGDGPPAPRPLILERL